MSNFFIYEKLINCHDNTISSKKVI